MIPLTLVSLLCATIFSSSVVVGFPSPESLYEKRLEAAKRHQAGAHGHHARRDTEKSTPSGVKNITFSNPKASEFYVNGRSLPEVDFDIGPSWAGLIPISGAKNETRKLFFWFFPPGPEGSLDDLIFWTNGGPGCSSLEGVFQESGPVIWPRGQVKPYRNQWSWTNLSSVLYLEQPIGTGFSQGTPTARNEIDIAEQIVGFLQQFLEIFKELKGKKFYLAGESYAGMYIPYTANYIYENTTRSTLDLNLQGIWINDPSIGWDVVQSQIPAVNFVHKYENVFAFNQTFLAHLDSVAEKCNYANYMEKYVKYPPQGRLPLPGKSTVVDPGCNVWVEILDAALLLNPGFDYYHILDTYPLPSDVLYPVPPLPNGATFYFNRADVKAAIHAPANVDWTLCASKHVFPQGDASLPSAFTVLPNVIEKSKRSVIAHGLLDFLLIAEGTRIALQNMTWGGKQGFQNAITPDSFILDGVGAHGSLQSERGLTYVELTISGHMVPADLPNAALQLMQYLMGFRSIP